MITPHPVSGDGTSRWYAASALARSWAARLISGGTTTSPPVAPARVPVAAS